MVLRDVELDVLEQFQELWDKCQAGHSVQQQVPQLYTPVRRSKLNAIRTALNVSSALVCTLSAGCQPLATRLKHGCSCPLAVSVPVHMVADVPQVGLETASGHAYSNVLPLTASKYTL